MNIDGTNLFVSDGCIWVEKNNNNSLLTITSVELNRPPNENETGVLTKEFSDQMREGYFGPDAIFVHIDADADADADVCYVLFANPDYEIKPIEILLNENV